MVWYDLALVYYTFIRPFFFVIIVLYMSYLKLDLIALNMYTLAALRDVLI